MSIISISAVLLSVIFLLSFIYIRSNGTKEYLNICQLLDKAKKEEQEDSLKALGTYRKTVGKMESVLKKYPQSRPAALIMIGNDKKETKSLLHYQKTVIPYLQQKAEEEQDPLYIALNLLDNLYNVKNRHKHILSIAECWARQGQWEKAMNTSRLIPQKEQTVRFRLYMASMVSMKKEKAENLLNVLTGSPEYLISIMLNIADELESDGKHGEAEKLMERAEEKLSEVQDSLKRYEAAGRLVTAYLKKDNTKAVFRITGILTEAENYHVPGYILVSLINYYSLYKRYDQVRQLMQLLDNVTDKREAESLMAVNRFSLGEEKEGLETLINLAEKAQTIQGGGKYLQLIFLFTSFTKTGNQELAAQVWENAESALNDMGSYNEIIPVLSRAVRKLKEEKKISLASKLTDRAVSLCLDENDLETLADLNLEITGESLGEIILNKISLMGKLDSKTSPVCTITGKILSDGIVEKALQLHKQMDNINNHIRLLITIGKWVSLNRYKANSQTRKILHNISKRYV